MSENASHSAWTAASSAVMTNSGIESIDSWLADHADDPEVLDDEVYDAVEDVIAAIDG